MNRRQMLTLGVTSFATAIGGVAFAQSRRPMREHTATAASKLDFTTTDQSAGQGRVDISTRAGKRFVSSNGIPSHAVGQYPNSGNPNSISAQDYDFEMTLAPQEAAGFTEGRPYVTGVGVNGVPFDPGAGEFWQGDPRLRWQYEALGGAVPLGLDANYAHVQPTGAYHYHGMPVGLMQQLGWSKSAPSPLLGWAADGFPIYAMMAEVNGRLTEMTSGWRLRNGTRPGGAEPDGRYDGAFTRDYVYQDGAGTLDEANGRVVQTQDHPEGIYAYFLTASFPVVPRVFAGTPDRSFAKGRP